MKIRLTMALKMRGWKRQTNQRMEGIIRESTNGGWACIEPRNSPQRPEERFLITFSANPNKWGSWCSHGFTRTFDEALARVNEPTFGDKIMQEHAKREAA